MDASYDTDLEDTTEQVISQSELAADLEDIEASAVRFEEQGVSDLKFSILTLVDQAWTTVF